MSDKINPLHFVWMIPVIAVNYALILAMLPIVLIAWLLRCVWPSRAPSRPCTPLK